MVGAEVVAGAHVVAHGGAHGSHSTPRFLKHQFDKLQLDGPRHPVAAAAEIISTNAKIASLFMICFSEQATCNNHGDVYGPKHNRTFFASDRFCCNRKRLWFRYGFSASQIYTPLCDVQIQPSLFFHVSSPHSPLPMLKRCYIFEDSPMTIIQ